MAGVVGICRPRECWGAKSAGRPNSNNQSPEAVAFYEFTRTMQSYKSIIAENTTLVLSTGSDLFKFLKAMSPDGDVVPAQRSGDNR